MQAVGFPEHVVVAQFSFGDEEASSIRSTTFQAITKCEGDIREDRDINIVVSDGTTMFEYNPEIDEHGSVECAAQVALEAREDSQAEIVAGQDETQKVRRKQTADATCFATGLRDAAAPAEAKRERSIQADARNVDAQLDGPWSRLSSPSMMSGPPMNPGCRQDLSFCLLCSHCCRTAMQHARGGDQDRSHLMARRTVLQYGGPSHNRIQWTHSPPSRLGMVGG